MMAPHSSRKMRTRMKMIAAATNTMTICFWGILTVVIGFGWSTFCALNDMANQYHSEQARLTAEYRVQEKIPDGMAVPADKAAALSVYLKNAAVKGEVRRYRPASEVNKKLFLVRLIAWPWDAVAYFFGELLTQLMRSS